MEPTIPDGSQVEIESLERPPSLMDVVAAITDDDEFVLHRVIGISGDGSVLLKPDGYPWIDSWVAAHNVKGRVSAILKDGQWINPPHQKSQQLESLRKRAMGVAGRGARQLMNWFA